MRYLTIIPLLMMTDEENAHQCAENTQRPETGTDSRPYASIDANQEIGPVLNIETGAVIDVPGVEVQVLPLSFPRCSVWILTSRGHERFVNEIHRHNSNIVNYSSSLRTKEENFDNVGFESSKPAVVNHEQSSQDSNNVKTKDESSGVLRETVASTMRVNPASSKSSSGGSGGRSNPMSTTSENKVHLHKERDPQRGQNLDHNSWMPEMQKTDSVETRISKCVTNTVRHHDQDERETDGAMHWNVINTSSIERKIPKSNGKTIHRRGLAAFILEASRQGFKSVKMKMEN